jgi:hypothetical protein
MPDPIETFIAAAWPEFSTFSTQMQAAIRTAIGRGLAAVEAAAWRPIEEVPRDGKTYVLVAPSPIRGVAAAVVCPLPTGMTAQQMRAVGLTQFRSVPTAPKEPTT